MKYIIIGNGVAGTTAAAAIRKTDSTGEIQILTEEPYPFYSRIRLMEYISGDVDLSKLQIKNQAWYEENKIQLALNNRVTEIDSVAREVVTPSGEKFSYDKLLLATGAVSFLPPIKGSDKKGVFTLRNIEDAEAIKKYAQGKSKALLIGGGLLGLEVGNSLRKAGLTVSVAEFFPGSCLGKPTRPAPSC